MESSSLSSTLFSAFNFVTEIDHKSYLPQPYLYKDGKPLTRNSSPQPRNSLTAPGSNRSNSQLAVRADCPIRQHCLIRQHIADLGNVKSKNNPTMHYDYSNNTFLVFQFWALNLYNYCSFGIYLYDDNTFYDFWNEIKLFACLNQKN